MSHDFSSTNFQKADLTLCAGQNKLEYLCQSCNPPVFHCQHKVPGHELIILGE